MTSHIAYDVIGDVIIAVTSWRHLAKRAMVPGCLGASALFWATWLLEMLQNMFVLVWAGESQGGNPIGSELVLIIL